MERGNGGLGYCNTLRTVLPCVEILLRYGGSEN